MQNENESSDIIENHPEIKYAILELTFPFWAQCNEGGLIVEYKGKKIDEEQSYYGARGNIPRFLEDNELWNVIIDDKVIAENCRCGVLRIENTVNIQLMTRWPFDSIFSGGSTSVETRRVLRTDDMPLSDEETYFDFVYSQAKT